MNNEHIPDQDEARLKQLLSSIDSNAPRPDAAVLDRIRQLADAEFTRSAPTATLSRPADETTLRQSISSLNRSPRRYSMLAFAARIALTASAAVMLVAAWLVPMGHQSVARATPFSKVLQELRGASTLRLELV